MAIQGALPVEFGTVFPHGAFALGVEAVTNFETKRPEVGRETGLPLWAVEVIDAAPRPALARVRFGPQVDAKGVLAGSPDADRCIRYLAKYLTKDIAECHTVETVAQEQHVERLLEALRYEQCSPRCAN